MHLPCLTLLATLVLATLPARAEQAERPDSAVAADFELRYRYEGVDQAGTADQADANTVRLRLRATTRELGGLSALLELDHVAAIGAEQFNDTRNDMPNYPVVADPQGTDLNQAWIQYTPTEDTWLRIGRQRINFDNQRFVGSSDWRQNEQTLDGFRIETTALRGLATNYAYVGRVNRVFGPDSGTPRATFDGDSHLLNVRLSSFAAGSLVVYAYLLDFDDALQLSSRSVGARYAGSRVIGERVSLGWAGEYARQRDYGGNPLDIDASYALIELRVQAFTAEFQAGREILSGVRGHVDLAASPAFQTPLATLHKWQGWADMFTSTPPAGVRDTYAGVSVERSHWRFQAVWHDFQADATALDYGTELDLSATYTFAERHALQFKFADHRARGKFTDTRKAWVQLGLSF